MDLFSESLDLDSSFTVDILGRAGLSQFINTPKRKLQEMQASKESLYLTPMRSIAEHVHQSVLQLNSNQVTTKLIHCYLCNWLDKRVKTLTIPPTSATYWTKLWSSNRLTATKRLRQSSRGRNLRSECCCPHWRTTAVLFRFTIPSARTASSSK